MLICAQTSSGAVSVPYNTRKRTRTFWVWERERERSERVVCLLGTKTMFRLWNCTCVLHNHTAEFMHGMLSKKLTNKKKINLGMASHISKKKKKSREMPLHILNPIPPLNCWCHGIIWGWGRVVTFPSFLWRMCSSISLLSSLFFQKCVRPSLNLA